MTTAAVRTIGMSKRFGPTVALDHLDLEVARGECLGLAGSNGGGRTTLLRILATLLCPSTGTVEIVGIDAVRRVHEARSHLAFVGEESLPGSGLRVREYLEFVHTARRSTADGTSRAVDAVLERAGLQPDAPVDALSSGFRQRLALAGALLIEPDVLLLDDPVHAIDAATRSRFLEWLQEIRGQGTTILVAFSDQRDTNALCHRVVQLEAGHLVARGERAVGSDIRSVPFAALTAGGA
jgi:ABC-2 type transport system ATP-binding protein